MSWLRRNSLKRRRDDAALVLEIAMGINAIAEERDRLRAELERAEARVAKLEDLIHTFNAARGMSKPLLCTREVLRKGEEEGDS